MSNMRLLHLNVADDGTFTGVTSEQGTMVIENTQDQRPGKVWRSTSAVNQQVTLDLGSAKNINFIAFWNINHTTSGEVQIRGTDDVTFATTEYNQFHDLIDTNFDFDNSQTAKFFVLFMSSTINARYWRFIFDDTTNPDGYHEVGRIVMGEYFEPTGNINYGFRTDWRDDSQLTRTRGGVWYSREQVPHRAVTASLQWLSTAEANTFLDLKARRGRRNDVLFSGYPGEGSVRERNNTVLGIMSDWSANSHDSLNYNSVSFTVEESI